MRTVLALQVPADNWSKSHILAVSTDAALIGAFCEAVLAERSEEADQIQDADKRRLAQLEIEQLKARLELALRTEGGSHDLG